MNWNDFIAWLNNRLEICFILSLFSIIFFFFADFLFGNTFKADHLPFPWSPKFSNSFECGGSSIYVDKNE